MNLELIEYLETFITDERKNRLQEVLAQRTKHFTVAVEDVYQMHNASAIVRSCDVFGIQEAHFIEINNKQNLDKNIALGAEKWIQTYHHTDTASCVEVLKNQGYQIVATSPHSSAHLLSEFDISKPSAFLLGTEKEGLSKQAMELAHVHLKIPMVGFTESLNISVAAAIILQHVTQLLRMSPLDWRLSPQEKNEVHLSWLMKSVKNSEKIIANLRKRS